MLKVSVSTALQITWDLQSLYINSITLTSFCGIPKCLKILHRESRWMLSNAFSRSMKLEYREVFHSLLYLRVKMCSEHERPGRKPACSCLMCSSSAAANLVWMILLKTLLVIGSSAMPLQLLHSPKSPFLGNLTMSPVFHASGICSLSHISLNTSV